MASRLERMMAEKKAARKAASTKIVPVAPTAPLATPADTVTANDATDAEVGSAPVTKPTGFRAPSNSISGLSQISTRMTEELTAAEERVEAQRAAGVYDVPEEVQQLMGADADKLIVTMQELDAALIEKTPEIRTLSNSIRKNLEQYPELTHILTDKQLHIMVQGYLTIANVKTAPKTKAAKTASANKKADATIKSLGTQSVDSLF